MLRGCSFDSLGALASRPLYFCRAKSRRTSTGTQDGTCIGISSSRVPGTNTRPYCNPEPSVPSPTVAPGADAHTNAPDFKLTDYAGLMASLGDYQSCPSEWCAFRRFVNGGRVTDRSICRERPLTINVVSP